MELDSRALPLTRDSWIYGLRRNRSLRQRGGSCAVFHESSIAALLVALQAGLVAGSAFGFDGRRP